MTASSDAPDLAGLEAAIGVQFRDRRLLVTALTHRSFLNEAAGGDVTDNERLEFLGDALVDFVAADHLYRCLPEAREGDLTTLRAALVRESALAAFARVIDLGRYLRLGRGEEASGGRTRAPLQCNAFEALVGALFLDQGLATVERFVLHFLEPELEIVLRRHRLKDAKSRFQEFAQRAWQVTPRYVTAAESGPDHAKSFVVHAMVGDAVWGTGSGMSKALAAQEAAEAALDRWAEARRSGGPDAMETEISVVAGSSGITESSEAAS